MASVSTASRQPENERTNAFDGIAPSPSTSATSSTLRKMLTYDVFINHRGPDVKHTLANTIYRTLNGMTLTVFLDSEELELGDFLPTTIEEAIRSASLHIAIFSENYAQSAWCLAELSFMLNTGSAVVPIFYHVQPEDLRWVGKGIYAHAFSQHEKKGRYTLEKLQEWKNALHNVSFYSGHIVNNEDDEGRLLKNIVNCVLKVIKKIPLLVAKHPVGLNEAINDFEITTLQSDLLSHHNVQIVGIWGMGGSGKTTLAKELYNKKRSSMARSSFLFDVRDAAAKSLLHTKQMKLLEDLGVKSVSFDNIEEGKAILASRLRSVCVLVILDDVDHVDQLDALLPAKDSLGSGSLIIVTTRELEVLRSWGISAVYKVKTLDPCHAEQLFCWHAFLQPSPLDGFEDLVKIFLKLCNGLPLSLKVFGGQLYGNSNKDYWQSLLEKISKILPNDIKQKLKVSYDDLDEVEREIFLDTACFFIGEDHNLAIEVWDGSGWSGLHGWERLVSKCLVELDENNCIRMHDHLRDLGREIANKQSPYRLFFPGQIINVKKRTEMRKEIANQKSPSCLFCAGQPAKKRLSIRGMMAATAGSTSEADEFPCSSNGDLKINTSKGFRHLRPSWLGLNIFVVRGHYFNQVIGKLLKELVWLRWFQIGQRNLPSWLSLKNLRVLELYDDKQLEELWEASIDVPVQLRELVISSCDNFKRFPKSIGRLKHLKKVVVSGGSNLKSLPEEFCLLQSLEHLQLRGNFSMLPSSFGDLTNLRHLDLSGCWELTGLPVSFKQLTLLRYLDFSRCKMLIFNSKTADILENMRKLEILKFTGCWELEELPRHITNQASLRELYLDGTNLIALPTDIDQLSKLQVMKIRSEFLKSLPMSFGNLSSLNDLLIKCPELESLPDSLGRLNLLEDLTMWNLGVNNLPKSVRQLINLQSLKIWGCPIRELDFGPGPFSSSLCNLKEIYLRNTRVSQISISEDCCPNLETLTLRNNHHLTEIEALPTTVKDIELHDCEMLKNIRGIGGLVNLQKLMIISCRELDGLPSFEQFTSLKELVMNTPTKVQKIRGLENCRTLEKLVADTTWEIPGIENLELMERLGRLQLTTYKRSALPCIQTLQKWPGELIICTRAVRDAGSLINWLAFPNLCVVDSFFKKKTDISLKLVHNRSSNADAIMVCFVINCVSPYTELNIGSSDGHDMISTTLVGEGKWVWVGIFTQPSGWLSAKEYQMSQSHQRYDDARQEDNDNEVEKGLLVTGEEQRLVEAFHLILKLLGN